MLEQGNSLSQNGDEQRLWIGNLDPRVTEYQLLKLLQTHGPIKKFDLLFHRTGTLTGQPRGYAFVTYKRKEDAIRAKTQLHSTQVGSKNIVVTWAHTTNEHTEETVSKSKNEVVIPALAMSKNENKQNRESQIEAIEAKLKLMEKRNSNDFEINKTVAAESSVVANFQRKSDMSTSKGASIKNKYTSKRTDKRKIPYNKQYSRK